MLKGFFERHKGCSFGFKMSRLFWEIRYAFQRAYRGYDYTDICNLNTNFVDRMINILGDFNENNIALWWKLDTGGIENAYTREETIAIIEEMIEHFTKSDREGWLDIDSGTEKKMTPEEIDDFEKNAAGHLDKALKMFTKYFDQLWY